MSPDRHADENGFAERACGILEVVVKSLLVQRALPPTWWQRCAVAAVFLLNRFPVTNDDVAFPLDGDAVRPLEVFTRFYYSRRQIDRELSYYIGPGELCMVHDTSIAGSNLQPKVRWGVSSGAMHMETPSFYCPYTGDMYSFKSYTAYRLKARVLYHSFLNISPPKRSKKSVSIILDNDVVPTIILKEPEEYKLDIDRFSTVNCKPSGNVSEDGVERVDTSKARARPNALSVPSHSAAGQSETPRPETETVPQKGGSITVVDSTGRLLSTDPSTGTIGYPDTHEIAIDKVMSVHDDVDKVHDVEVHNDDDHDETEHDGKDLKHVTHGYPDQISLEAVDMIGMKDNSDRLRKSKKQKAAEVETMKDKSDKVELPKSVNDKSSKLIKRTETHEDWNLGDSWISIEEDLIVMDDVDVLAADSVKDKGTVIKNMQTLKNAVVKGMKIPVELVKTYREWLIHEHGYNPEDIPDEGKEYSKPGTVLIYPSGKAWHARVSKKYNKYVEQAAVIAEGAMMSMLMYGTVDIVRTFST